jgi:3-dehydroquinate synthase
VEATRLTVKGSIEYPVIIGPGVLETALPEFVAEKGFSSVAVISNDRVGPLYGERLAERLPGGYLITVPDGERHKNLKTVRDLYDALLRNGADRSTLVVALGGGVVGDMAGFVAATFMRGLPLVQAPTSLLAMVDASIGGKVGVDLPQGKNLVGAFKDPLAVFADTATLATLPPVELRCGLAEVVKGGLVGDSALLDHLMEHGPQPVESIIERTAAVKTSIVQQDRLEHGVRVYLNLGHTFGHALEQVSGYAWRHGEAVAVGLGAAARLSARLGLCDGALIEQVEGALRSLGLPVCYTDFSPNQLWDAMRHDKKRQGDSLRFVLLRGVGQPVIQDGVPRDAVLEVLDSLKE